MSEKNELNKLNNENGSILIITLILSAMLVLIGVSMTTTSTVEVQIAGNEKVYKKNLYKAESAGMEAAQKMADDADFNKNNPDWVVSAVNTKPNYNSMINHEFWASGSTTIENSNMSNSKYTAYLSGIAKGSSLDASRRNIYIYEIIGNCEEDNGQVIVRLGFRKE